MEIYLAKNGLEVKTQLGAGKDGEVLKTNRNSALKIFKTSELYHRELRAYQLLSGLSIRQIEGFTIPRLLHFDEPALLIEMTIVSPPYMLDFASCVDEFELEFLGFSEDVWAERQLHWAEIFGPDWPVIQAATMAFERLTGLAYLDPSLNNIRPR